MDQHKIIKELRSLFYIILVAFLLKVTLIEAYIVPTGSMEKTIMTGDFLIGNRFVYGMRTPDWIGIPYTDIGFKIPYFRFPKFREPKQGDVIIFKYPRDPHLKYVKRCIAEPGDTLKIVNREIFINNLLKKCKNIKFDIYGLNKIQPIWADSFLKSISNAKMGVNLSRGDPIKYYSSDRITQLIGNGLLTFIHKNTHYNNFFSNKEVIFYSNINNLSEKIQKFAKDDFQRKKIAKNGKQKYMKYFNSTLVADYIVKNTFNIPYKKSSFMWESK